MLVPRTRDRREPNIPPRLVLDAIALLCRLESCWLAGLGCLCCGKPLTEKHRTLLQHVDLLLLLLLLLLAACPP